MTDDSTVPPLDLDALLDLLNRATPGPWRIGEENEVRADLWSETAKRIIGTIKRQWIGDSKRRDDKDAELIVAAVNALPALVAAARESAELRRERDAARAEAAAAIRIGSNFGSVLKALGNHGAECPAYKQIGRYGSHSGFYWSVGDEKLCDCPLGRALALAPDPLRDKPQGVKELLSSTLAAHQASDDLRAERDAAREEVRGLREALKLCIEWMPRAEVRNWPPGFRLRDEAITAARAALSETSAKTEKEGLE